MKKCGRHFVNDTLKLLQPFINPHYNSLSLEELAIQYQLNAETAILATSFSKIFKLAIIIKNEYYGLDDTDIASWCLEKLDYCLKTFSGNNKFSTYFSTVFKNKLREETERLNYKKRKGILESINELLDIGIDDTYNLIDMLLPKNLTDKEYTYCILASEGYDNSYIAQKLDVSRMTISNIRKSLKVKCETLQN